MAKGMHWHYSFDTATSQAIVTSIGSLIRNFFKVAFKLIGVYTKSPFITVNKMWNCPAIGNRVGRGNESQGRQKNFIVSSDICQQKAYVQCGRTVHDSYCSLYTSI